MWKLRRLLPRLAALGFLLAPSAAVFAQAPPPVAALPDSERRTSYAISGTTCACAVNFQLYASGTDVDAWIEVWVGGVRHLSTDPTFGWSLSSTPPLATAPRPITNAVLTFNSVQTGTVQIVGAERPRRLAQVAENRGVAARDFNQAITDLVAVERELWDKTNDVTGRAILGLPGETMKQLPPAATRANNFLSFDSSGNPVAVPTITFTGATAVGQGLTLSGTTLLTAAGVDANVLNAQTGAYAAVSSDCGKTITLGGSAFYTLTVGAASGFAGTCSIVIANIDSGRGKAITINGITFPNNGILWPLQTFTLKNTNNSWTIINPPGRWKITGSTTFHISKTLGSNSNDGLASGAGAFAGLNTGLSIISQIVDAAQNSLTVQVDDCLGGSASYNESVTLPNIVNAISGSGIGGGSPTLIGNTAAPDNCILTSGAAQTLLAINTQEWIVEGFEITNTTSNCVVIDVSGWIRWSNIDFNSCNSGANNTIVAENGGVSEISGNITISSSANAFAFASLGGRFIYGSGTITCANTPAWGSSFAFSANNSLQNWSGATFSCTSTGPRYTAKLGGGIDTNGGGATFLPGNSAGTATSPGWYN